MQLKRVVITGMGAVSPYGRGCDVLWSALSDGQSGIRRCEALEEGRAFGPRVAGLVQDVEITQVPRKHRRSMSRMSVYALLAAQEALDRAHFPETVLRNGQVGLSIGSTLGSVDTIETFFRQYLAQGTMEQMTPMLFFRVMGHSVAANVAQALGITGRLLAPAAACSTSCQAIGLAYECIASGRQDAMLCGGADEYHPLTTGTFDLMLAASAGYNDTPQATPKPFDVKRDGMVCSEGAGVLLLESLDIATDRGANILAEVVGFASTTDSSSIATPAPHTLANCMRLALNNAKMSPADIAYVNAHATATIQGDIAESHAIAQVFGNAMAVSSLKGHMGHTMAASGALELIVCVNMLRNHELIPTLHLKTPDRACAALDYVQEKRSVPLMALIKNNFALGGINCSLILRRYDD